MLSQKSLGRWIIAGLVLLALAGTRAALAHTWNEAAFANRPLFAYPMPSGHDALIGSLTTFKVEKGDTLLDIGRWYGLSGKELSDANGHLDWWAPPAGRDITLTTEHILPEGPRTGIVMNIPEMRIYYYYPSSVTARRHRKLTRAAFRDSGSRVVYTFPVGLGRFDWKTPVGVWTVTAKVKNPTWVVPQDIYEEHLERDGEAEHVVLGGDPDNPLGHYKLALSLPEYAIHGTDVPWGVGMNISHGCIRLYPEDIERLFMKTPVGTPGRFVYQPIKFGWRGDALYVEVHDDLYAVYPGLWNHALDEVKRLHLEDDLDVQKLQKAVELRSGVPTYVMTGPEPGAAVETASASLPPSPSGGPIVAASTAVMLPSKLPTAITSDSGAAPTDGGAARAPAATEPPPVVDPEARDGNWEPVPSGGGKTDSSVE